MSEKINDEHGESVDLNLATADQIFCELCRRYNTLILVADGDVLGRTKADDGKCGEVVVEFKGNPFTLLGLSHFSMKEITRSIG